MSNWLDYINELLRPKPPPVFNKQLANEEILKKKLSSIEDHYFPGIQFPPKDSVLFVAETTSLDDDPLDTKLIESLDPGIFDD